MIELTLPEARPARWRQSDAYDGNDADCQHTGEPESVPHVRAFQPRMTLLDCDTPSRTAVEALIGATSLLAVGSRTIRWPIASTTPLILRPGPACACAMARE